MPPLLSRTVSLSNIVIHEKYVNKKKESHRDSAIFTPKKCISQSIKNPPLYKGGFSFIGIVGLLNAFRFFFLSGNRHPDETDDKTGHKERYPCHAVFCQR